MPNCTTMSDPANDHRYYLRRCTPPSIYCCHIYLRNTTLLNCSSPHPPLDRRADKGAVTAAAATRTQGTSAVVDCLSGKHAMFFGVGARRTVTVMFSSAKLDDHPVSDRVSSAGWRPIDAISPVCRSAGASS